MLFSDFLLFWWGGDERIFPNKLNFSWQLPQLTCLNVGLWWRYVLVRLLQPLLLLPGKPKLDFLQTFYHFPYYAIREEFFVQLVLFGLIKTSWGTNVKLATYGQWMRQTNISNSIYGNRSWGRVGSGTDAVVVASVLETQKLKEEKPKAN